jgi:S1-C subfamily serine protease
MKRRLRAVGIITFVGIVVFALWIAWGRFANGSVHESLENAVHSVVSNSEVFAKVHFTGGVGVVLGFDQTNGVPNIMQVRAGTPAEKAGLLKGDRIIQADGVATKGRSLAQDVKDITGFAGGSVTLTIQRENSTNLQFVIHRSSWTHLGVTNVIVP